VQKFLGIRIFNGAVMESRIVRCGRGLRIGALYPFALLLFLCLDRISRVAAYGLETAVYGAKTDPLGEKDIFLTLPPAIKRRLSNPVNFDTDEKLRTLGSLESTTLIHVKLVGFSSEHHRLSVLESELGAYLASLTQDLHASIIGHAQHKLIPKTKITVEVGRVQENLAEKIHAAIDQHIENVCV
jgi:hypothetical protein